MDISEQKKVWESWAREDPLWAILSDPSKSERRWDKEEFLATGTLEIDQVMSHLSNKGISINRQRSLDFGCGVGRLTQGLAHYFDRCDGVDISDTMIRKAREWNRYPNSCFYHVNDNPDLHLFSGGSFDFIYSNIVLQHIKPELSTIFIKEFVRLLSDNGIALFQIPSSYTTTQYEHIPDSAHVASLRLTNNPPELIAGDRSQIFVEVTNGSSYPWPSVPSLKLGNHWKSLDGSTTIALDDGRSPLLKALNSHQGTTVGLIITAPETPGTYLLELDVVEEEVGWFSDFGSQTLQVPVRVSPARRSLINRLFPFRNTATHAQIPPKPFGMYGVPRDEVVQVVTANGGLFLDIEDYNPAGQGWESYRYCVTKQRTTP